MWRPVALLLAMLMALPAMASGQSTLCSFVGDTVSKVDIGGGVMMLILHDPFVANCDDGTELRADSGQANEVSGEIQLVGNVYFRDVSRTLTADNADYNRETGRLYATGNVELIDDTAERKILRGPELEYFRENESRPEALIFATQRPTLILEPSVGDGDAPEDAEPLTLIGDRVDIVGNDDLTATGDVVITRSDMTATAEEAHYDAGAESLELRQDALISREGYSLVGEVIQARMADGSLEFVQSRTDARLDGEDLIVAAPDIQLFFAADTLQQVVARVPPDVPEERARAAAKTFRMEADSIDAMFELGALNTVYAIGAARGETIDTTQAGAAELEMLSAPAVGTEALALETPVQVADSLNSAAEPSPPVAVDEAPEVNEATPLPADRLDDGGDGTPGELAGGPDSEDAVEIPPSPESIRAVTASDWIRGDTIIAFFASEDTTVVSDSTAVEAVIVDADAVPAPTIESAADPDEPALADGEPADADPVDCGAEPCPDAVSEVEEEEDTPELRKLIARNGAQSFYRLASETPGDPDCRDLSFLVGAEIELDVADGELEVANVVGLEQGIYLEATNCAAAAPAPADLPVEGPDDPAAEVPEPTVSTPDQETAMAGRWR